MSYRSSPAEVQKLLRHLRTVKNRHPDAPYPPSLETIPRKSLPQVDYVAYVHSGEHNYAVARLLLELRITNYGLFCAQQAIETYLKAFACANGVQPRMIHSLPELLNDCRKANSTATFIMSDDAMTIVKRFDPFNELARYPIHKTRPSGGIIVSIYPDDLRILDYFVYCMRPLIPLPGDHASLFTRGTPDLMNFEAEYPEVYALIRKSNMNFPPAPSHKSAA